jgi:hypothetical protein
MCLLCRVHGWDFLRSRMRLMARPTVRSRLGADFQGGLCFAYHSATAPAILLPPFNWGGRPLGKMAFSAAIAQSIGIVGCIVAGCCGSGRSSGEGGCAGIERGLLSHSHREVIHRSCSISQCACSSGVARRLSLRGVAGRRLPLPLRATISAPLALRCWPRECRAAASRRGRAYRRAGRDICRNAAG